jgi:hypothetical protein
MFPRAGFQIFTETDSPEDFHVMEVKNVSRDRQNVTRPGRIASGEWGFLRIHKPMSLLKKSRGTTGPVPDR